jgi:hypothetical protein
VKLRIWLRDFHCILVGLPPPGDLLLAPNSCSSLPSWLGGQPEEGRRVSGIMFISFGPPAVVGLLVNSNIAPLRNGTSASKGRCELA